jgi:DDE superfamily endonuclease
MKEASTVALFLRIGEPSMLPGVILPAGLVGLLRVFRGCFTGPSFVTFCAMVLGSVAATGRRTVCGMLVGAGLSRVWPHDRAHWFFARARWDATQVGLVLARLVVDLLLPAGAAVTVAVDDTLFKRWGPKVFGRAWQHDGAAKTRGQVSSGVCFVVVGVVVQLPFCAHPTCLPLLARLWRPAPKAVGGRLRRPARSATAATAVAVQRAQARLDRAGARRDARTAKLAANGGWLPGCVPDLNTPVARAEQALTRAWAAHQAARAALGGHSGSSARRRGRGGGPAADAAYPTKTEIAVDLASRVAAAFADRSIHVVADAAYHSPALRHLPANLTWTFRLAKSAVLHDLPPARTGRRGRPPVKGNRLGTPAQIAATAPFTPTTVRRNGTHRTATIAVITCRWHSSLGTTTVRLTLTRNPQTTTGYDLALLTTDLNSTATAITNRYATRWSIEVCFHDARQHLGTGQPHNRTRTAVERTIPFQLAVYSLVVIWYTHTGHHPTDITTRRLAAPWYTTKTTPAFADMIAKLRRIIIAANTQYPPTHPDQAIPQQIRTMCPTCETVAA